MGVKGLWRLLLPIGRRISLETLHGKVLAIDASIWLTQFLKAMRDPETGRVQASAHLIGFFRRLCRLRFHGIKPVFVFDGATPEIKKRELAQRRRRRERFETLGGDAAVQRMARRLLAETLQKQKNAKSGKKNAPVRISTTSNKSRKNVAFAPGFNPGGEQQEQKEEQPSEVIYGDNEDNGTNVDSQNDQQVIELLGEDEGEDTMRVDKVATGTTVDLLDDGDDLNQKKQDTEEITVNDWDNPVIELDGDGDNESGAGEAATEEKEGNDSDEVEYEDFGLRMEEEDSEDDLQSQEKGDGFNLSHIALLPSSKRKDAIEDAKRKLRLRSRKEFMPAAANPQNFSQVQLSNFLRSTKLNKSIVEMATKAAKKDNQGLIGEAMASDRTTRVELIREDDVATRVETFTRQGNTITRDRFARRREGSDPSVEESSDSDCKPAARKGKPARQHRVIDDSDEDSECGGGFLPAESATNVASLPRKHPPATSKQNVFDDEVSSEAYYDGGFFAEEYASLRGTGARSNDGSPSRPDAVVARELADRALAEALQRVEDEPHSVNLSRVAVSEREMHRALNEDFSAGTAKNPLDVEDKKLPATRSGVDIMGENSESSDDDIDWEDGAPVEVEGAPKSKKDTEETEELGSSGEDIEWKGGDEAGLNLGAIYVGKELLSTSADKRSVQCRSGEVEELRKPSPAYDEVQAGGERQSQSNNIEQAGGEAVAMSISRKDKEAPDVHEEMDKNSETASAYGDELGTETFSDFEEKKELFNDETTAALERAQATASGLADWAGRVFRRAIKEASKANGESPDKRGDETMEREAQGEDSSPIEAKTPSSKVNKDNVSLPSSQKDEGIVQTSTGTCTPLAASTAVDLPPNTQQLDVDNRVFPGEEAATSEYDPATFDPVTLHEEETRWKSERNQRERDADTVTDEMRLEAVQLLRLFGVPYVESPAEAEAQCAALEELGLVDGIVTEDSDVFVFGGKTVYKHIFDEMKYVEVYLASDAEREMALGRNQMVALAMLLGGDYTEGVKGVGIVNAMELLQAFDVTDDLQKGLQGFRKWLDGFDPIGDMDSTDDDPLIAAKERAFYRKHRSARSRWSAPDSFPSEQVLKAYMNPVVDKSDASFTWGAPNVDGLVRFCERNIGWTASETMRFLNPVLKRESSGLRQMRIDSFMKYEDTIKFADVRSKRLRDVLGLTREEEPKRRGEKRQKAQRNKKN